MMKNTFTIPLFSLLLFLGFACSTDSGETVPQTPTGPAPSTPIDPWLIPDNQILDGGPGKDGIPSIDVPSFSSISEINFLNDEDLVIGIKVGDEVRAYPHPILDWHEIVNDMVEDVAVAVTYCPLTGTAIGWDRRLDNTLTTFGVSGLLFNTNLMPYDRATDSYWSQMRLDCVKGSFSGTRIEFVPLVETTWATWKQLYPDSRVLNTNTGFDRDYGRYPYGPYRTNNSMLIFPIEPDDPRLPRKERVLGIIVNEVAKAYRFNNFPGSEITIVQDQFQGRKLVIAGSTDRNFLVAYESELEDGTALEFLPIEGDVEPGVIMLDTEGNQWNLFGEAVAGPRAGEKLITTESFMGYWLAWGAFYPDLEIYVE